MTMCIGKCALKHFMDKSSILRPIKQSRSHVLVNNNNIIEIHIYGKCSLEYYEREGKNE
jgi:hypothetical protein